MSSSSATRSPLKNLTGNEFSATRAAEEKSLSYPMTIAVPSRGLVQALFECDDSVASARLARAGLLSFEQVLLPAVACQEDQALKSLQAVVQRDLPDKTPVIVACRKAVYDSIGAAVRAAETSRKQREEQEVSREQIWDELRRDKSQFRETERRRELKKQLPRNQEMWREVAYLMTELSKLQKEERLWKQANVNLDERERELAQQEESQAAEQKKMEVDQNEDSIVAKHADLDMVDQSVQDITLSSIRIQKALSIIANIVTESDKIRKELYHKYRQEHQFHGYHGVKDAKGLLRALSQDS